MPTNSDTITDQGDVLVYELDEASMAVRVSKLRPFDAEWHKAVSATLQDEWNSTEDDEAFSGLQHLNEPRPATKRKT